MPQALYVYSKQGMKYHCAIGTVQKVKEVVKVLRVIEVFREFIILCEL